MSNPETEPGQPRTDPSDVTSWTAVQSGDLDYVIRRFWNPIHRFLRSRLGSGVDAEATTQEFFMQFLQRHVVERMDPTRGTCRAFMFHMARQFLIDVFRRQAARKRSLAEVRATTAKLQRLESEDPGPQEEFDRQWFLSLLNAARREVKAACRERGSLQAYQAFRMYYFGSADAGSLSQADIASSLGISVTQVNNHVHRTRQRFARALRELVAEYCGPDAVDEELQSLARFLEGHRLQGPPPSSLDLPPPTRSGDPESA